MTYSRIKTWVMTLLLVTTASLIFSVAVFPCSGVNPREIGNEAKGVQKLPTSLSYYLTISGGGYVTVKDELGHSNAPVLTNATSNEIGDFLAPKVPNVSVDVLGKETVQVVMPVDQNYTITFQSGSGPISIELIKGEDNQTPERAVRYTDLVLPTGVSVVLLVTRNGIESLRYDKDGDGTHESTVPPTVDVSGPAARDITPPAVNFTERLVRGTCTVTITARDSSSGVKAIYYSFDNKKYEHYVRPLVLDVKSTPVVYAFADDQVANRSSISSHKLKRRCR